MNPHRMGGCQVNLKTTTGKPQRVMPEEQEQTRAELNLLTTASTHPQASTIFY